MGLFRVPRMCGFCSKDCVIDKVDVQSRSSWMILLSVSSVSSEESGLTEISN